MDCLDPPYTAQCMGQMKLAGLKASWSTFHKWWGMPGLFRFASVPEQLGEGDRATLCCNTQQDKGEKLLHKTSGVLVVWCQPTSQWAYNSCTGPRQHIYCHFRAIDLQSDLCGVTEDTVRAMSLTTVSYWDHGGQKNSMGQ